MIDEKKLLKHLSDWWLSETPSGDGTVLVINGELQKTPMMKTIEDFMETVEQQPKVGEWIPCSERLPEKRGNYLVTSKGRTWVANWFNYTWWGIEKNCRWTDVKAWMPLPEPYKEGAET